MLLLIPTAILFLFSIFNLIGIKPQLVPFQLLFFTIAIGAFFIFRKIGLSFFRQNAMLFYWIFVALLILTYVIGFEARGSKRWIDLYFFAFQPSEFFKIFFVIFFADFFSSMRKDSDEIQVFLKSLFYFALPTFIIFKQPDLGSALVYSCIYFTLLFFSYIPKKTVFTFAGLLAFILPFGWFFLHDYQKNRILSFVNPNIDSSGTGYNMLQAVITTGSGQFFGRGLGHGTQTKLSFLPENHTDFAFSSLVEQFGFVGGFIVLAAYFAIVMILVRRIMGSISKQDKNDCFKTLLLIGFLAYFVFQLLVNVSMNVGIFPVTGITLPFISYGGSSLLGLMISLALLP